MIKVYPIVQFNDKGEGIYWEAVQGGDTGGRLWIGRFGPFNYGAQTRHRLHLICVPNGVMIGDGFEIVSKPPYMPDDETDIPKAGTPVYPWHAPLVGAFDVPPPVADDAPTVTEEPAPEEKAAPVVNCVECGKPLSEGAIAAGHTRCRKCRKE